MQPLRFDLNTRKFEEMEKKIKIIFDRNGNGKWTLCRTLLNDISHISDILGTRERRSEREIRNGNYARCEW